MAENNQTTSTAEMSTGKIKMDIESLKDTALLFIAYSFVRMEVNGNTIRDYSVVDSTKIKLSTIKRNVIEVADNLLSTLLVEDYNEVLRLTKTIDFDSYGSTFHKDLFISYLLFLTFNEHATVNKNLDNRLTICTKTDYISVVEDMLENGSGINSTDEENMWNIAMDIHSRLR